MSKTRYQEVREWYNTNYRSNVQYVEGNFDGREIKLPIIETCANRPESSTHKMIPLCKGFDSVNAEVIKQVHAKIFADSSVMSSFAGGEIYSPEDFGKIVERSSIEWSLLGDFRGFVVTDIEASESTETDVVVAYTSLKHSNTHPAGTAELGYLVAKSSQGKGIAKETSGAVVCTYAQSLYDRGVCVHDFNDADIPINPQKFVGIHATVRVDNTPSQKILQNLGFDPGVEVEKYGSLRTEYSRGFDCGALVVVGDTEDAGI